MRPIARAAASALIGLTLLIHVPAMALATDGGNAVATEHVTADAADAEDQQPREAGLADGEGAPADGGLATPALTDDAADDAPVSADVPDAEGDRGADGGPSSWGDAQPAGEEQAPVGDGTPSGGGAADDAAPDGGNGEGMSPEAPRLSAGPTLRGDGGAGTVYAITYDLDGGHFPDGAEWPTSYVAGTRLILPGMKGQDCPEPVKAGYVFVGWADEEGEPIYYIDEGSRGDRVLTALWEGAPLWGNAYAVYNATDGSLTFLRSFQTLDDGPGQTVRSIIVGETYTGYVYGGIEELEATRERDVPWYSTDGHHMPFRSVSVAPGSRICPRSCAYWFSHADLLTDVNLAGLDTSEATSMRRMFSTCTSLTELDLGDLDTRSVTDMSWLFDSCTSLASLDMSCLDTDSTTTHSYMFNRCSALYRVVLGSGFTFKPPFSEASEDRAELPHPVAGDEWSGAWRREDDELVAELPYMLGVRFDEDPEGMSGAWVWEESKTYPITFDLAGGRVPEGETYPTEYRVLRYTNLPGYGNSGTSFPTRHGYRFLGWVDEEGQDIRRIDAHSRGPRTITATWAPMQLHVIVPATATLVATQGADGTIELAPEAGDFSLALTNDGEVPVTVTARATAAGGFSLSDGDGELADLEAEVWLTPATTGSDPAAEGYDPAADGGYREHGQVLLSRLGEGAEVGPALEPGGTTWLNGLGGRMGGWSTNPGTVERLLTIDWTFSLAPEA